MTRDIYEILVGDMINSPLEAREIYAVVPQQEIPTPSTIELERMLRGKMPIPKIKYHKVISKIT